MRVIVTRPALQADAWVTRLRALGVDAVALPLIAIAPAEDPGPVAAAWAELPRLALIMFVSANAVAHFFALRPPGTPWPPALRAGSTGPGTSAALRDAGVPASLIAEPAADSPSFDSEALWARLSALDWTGRQALVVRGETGRDWFADTLARHGAQVSFVTAYRRLPPTLDGPERALLDAALATPHEHLWHFSSSEAVARLGELTPGNDWAGAAALASHPRIAEAARALGFGRVERVAVHPEAVAAAVARLQAGGPSIQ